MTRLMKFTVLLFVLGVIIAGSFAVSKMFSNEAKATESEDFLEETLSGLEKEYELEKKFEKEVSRNLEEHIILKKKDISVVQVEDEEDVFEYVVTVEWEFPKGSELYEKDTSLNTAYVPIISKKHNLYTWSYDDVWFDLDSRKDLINASKKSGEVQLIFPNENEMLKELDKFLSIDYWLDAIVERKIALIEIKEKEEKRIKIEADIEKYNVQNNDF